MSIKIDHYICGHGGCADSDVRSLSTIIVAGRSSAANHGWLHARQATGSLAHIVGEAWTGPNRCPNGRESAVRVEA